MAKEIELKFLLKENGVTYETGSLYSLYNSVDTLKEDVLSFGKEIRQGYLPLEVGGRLAKEFKLKVDFIPTEARIRDKAGEFLFTLKDDDEEDSEDSSNRKEAETKIPYERFSELWPQTLGSRVEKCRLEKEYEGRIVEFDVYIDRDLIVAEIEVPTIEVARRINALGRNVSKDKNYKNRNLAK